VNYVVLFPWSPASLLIRSTAFDIRYVIDSDAVELALLDITTLWSLSIVPN